MKKLVLTLGLMVAVMLAAQAQSGEKKGSDKALTPKALAGAYKIVSGEHFGKAIAEKELETDQTSFTEDAVTVFDKNTKKVYAATYKLDSGKSPARIHMTSIEPKKGETADGLIKMEGDTVTLIYALPGGEVPTEFKTKGKQQMFTMKRVGK